MRRFRFVGDPDDMYWGKNPIKNTEYTLDELNEMRGGDKLDYWMLEPNSGKWAKENWQEVFETETKNLHKDTDLGYFAGLAMQGIMANPSDVIQALTDPQKAQYALIMAENLIKQLDSLHDPAPDHNE